MRFRAGVGGISNADLKAAVDAPHIVARAILSSGRLFANRWCFVGERQFAQGY